MQSYVQSQVGGCLPEDAVMAFVSGTFTGPARRAAELHLASCPECRALVSELARKSAGGVPTTATAFARTVPSERPPPPNAPPVLPGDLVGGKYEVEWTIGAGGMGVVVAAWHRLLGQRVAIKFPAGPLRGATEGRERLLREARACGRLRSEHTVRVLDVGTLEDGAPYVVMEYLVGRSLADRLREEGRLPLAEAVETVRHACAALAEAHASGIVHRDLKPSNLFETRRFDGTRVVKVIDFGIAKGPSLASEGEILTATRGVMGSPGYMPPEQIRSTRDADARADIWALGVSLCELLTGQLGPYPGGRAPVQPPGLERVVARCLEPDPARRFASARDLSDALAPFAGDPAKSQSPPPKRSAVAVWIPAVAIGSALLAGTATWVVTRMPRGATGSPTVAAAQSEALPTPAVASVPAPAPAPASVSVPPFASPATPTAISTSRPVPRMLGSARPAPPPAPSPADPHGLLDRK